MATTIYACDNCGFLFSRTGECTQCPDCGKTVIREATPKEKEEFQYRKEHIDENNGW